MVYINIDRENETPLSKQIYKSIKDAVLRGALRQGEKLPSSREQAKCLNVARNIVIESYEQLIAEGYAYSRNGSGTYICDGLEFQRMECAGGPKQVESCTGNKNMRISFRAGIPDLEAIPVKKWAQTYQKIALDIAPSELDYQDPFGDYDLRVQLSLYLNRARGAGTSPENIMITNGAAQSFDLLCRLVSPDTYALVENPLSYGILYTLKSNHVNVKPIDLDSEGMQTTKLPELPPKLIFTTPSHQFPTGVVLPVGRRIEMLKYAQRHDAYIVEDDYDSEFRFDGKPIQSMQYLNPERVIYVGTFSKTLMPALRIGYMVLPTALCAQMREAKYVADLHSPILEQRVLAQFIETGMFENHIRKMRKLYLKKRNHLIFCLKRSFGEEVTVSGAEAGLHFAAAFSGISFNNELLKKVEDCGIQIAAMKKHYLSAEADTPYDNSLIFGYGNTKIEDMEAGVELLSSVIRY